MASTFRLSPQRASRKLQALRFIKEHFAELGQSPSLGEIANALEVSRQSAHELVKALEADGLVIRKPGPRGLLLPEPAEMISRMDALLILQAAGWRVVSDDHLLSFPANDVFPLTLSGLPMLPELDHIPDVETGGMHDRDKRGG